MDLKNFGLKPVTVLIYKLVKIMNPESIMSEILTTKGIKSTVYENGTLQKYKVLGHVGFYDFDGRSKEFTLNNCMYEPGINALLESSINSYHVWNLSIKHINEVALDGLRLRSDSNHVGLGYREGRWVLRMAGKEYDNEIVYKSAPKLKSMWYNNSKLPQSKAHFKILMAFYNIACDAKLKKKCNLYKWAGCDRVTFDEYMTITDTVKPLIQ